MKPVINFIANDTNFKFNIEQNYTKVHDNSGTGKTFLCNSLKSAINTWEDTGVYPVKDAETNQNIKVKIVDGINANQDVDFSEKNTLFIIDEADIYIDSHPDCVDTIVDNDDSMFMFMLRSSMEGLSFDYDEKAHMSYDKNNNILSIQYYK